jgi:hypothetical protein
LPFFSKLFFHSFGFESGSSKRLIPQSNFCVGSNKKGCELRSKSQEINPENLILTLEIKYIGKGWIFWLAS